MRVAATSLLSPLPKRAKTSPAAVSHDAEPAAEAPSLMLMDVEALNSGCIHLLRYERASTATWMGASSPGQIVLAPNAQVCLVSSQGRHVWLRGPVSGGALLECLARSERGETISSTYFSGVFDDYNEFTWRASPLLLRQCEHCGRVAAACSLIACPRQAFAGLALVCIAKLPDCDVPIYEARWSQPLCAKHPAFKEDSTFCTPDNASHACA